MKNEIFEWVSGIRNQYLRDFNILKNNNALNNKIIEWNSSVKIKTNEDGSLTTYKLLKSYSEQNY